VCNEDNPCLATGQYCHKWFWLLLITITHCSNFQIVLNKDF
jgi:hypothetical protein